MYTTCLWCTADLGRNEVVETFPVGRRLAFDQAKGRLWVVCRQCERWNLTPIEERWEAIEACERLYRDARQRVSTDQIGLAKLREGLELVRIGSPLLPEFASWRYGDQFGRRFRRTMLWGAGGVAIMAGLAYGQIALGIGTMSLMNFVNPMLQAYRRKKRVTTLGAPEAAARAVPVTLHTAGLVRVAVRDGAWQLAVPRDGARAGAGLEHESTDVFQARDRRHLGLPLIGKLDPSDFAFFKGDAARAALGTLIPTINSEGGSKGTVADSVRLIESLGSAEQRAERLLQGRLSHTAPLGGVDKARRLALEMALHEADERRWLEGELSELERRWQEAEALAGIADRLLRPADAAG